MSAQVVNYSEEEIQFVNSYMQVAPDSVGGYFAAPSPHTFSFYRYPGSGAVFLMWTRHHWATSTKRTNVQRRLRRDLALIAEREGIKAVQMVTTFYHVPALNEFTNLTSYSFKFLRKRISLVIACGRQLVRRSPKELRISSEAIALMYLC